MHTHGEAQHTAQVTNRVGIGTLRAAAERRLRTDCGGVHASRRQTHEVAGPGQHLSMYFFVNYIWRNNGKIHSGNPLRQASGTRLMADKERPAREDSDREEVGADRSHGGGGRPHFELFSKKAAERMTKEASSADARPVDAQIAEQDPENTKLRREDARSVRSTDGGTGRRGDSRGRDSGAAKTERGERDRERGENGAERRQGGDNDGAGPREPQEVQGLKSRKERERDQREKDERARRRPEDAASGGRRERSRERLRSGQGHSPEKRERHRERDRDRRGNRENEQDHEGDRGRDRSRSAGRGESRGGAREAGSESGSPTKGGRERDNNNRGTSAELCNSPDKREDIETVRERARERVAQRRAESCSSPNKLEDIETVRERARERIAQRRAESREMINQRAREKEKEKQKREERDMERARERESGRRRETDRGRERNRERRGGRGHVSKTGRSDSARRRSRDRDSRRERERDRERARDKDRGARSKDRSKDRESWSRSRSRGSARSRQRSESHRHSAGSTVANRGGSSTVVSPTDEAPTVNAGSQIAAGGQNAGGAMPKRPTKEVIVPDWATPGCRTWFLQKEAGAGTDIIRLEGRAFVTLGRSSKASERLVANTCSGLHAMFAFRRGDGRLKEGSSGAGEKDSKPCLKDLESMHGTHVDGVKAASDAWTDLVEGSVIAFGDQNAALPQFSISDATVTYKLCRDKRNKAAGNALKVDMHFDPSPPLQRLLDSKQGGQKKAKSGREQTGRR